MSSTWLAAGKETLTFESSAAGCSAVCFAASSATGTDRTTSTSVSMTMVLGPGTEPGGFGVVGFTSTFAVDAYTGAFRNDTARAAARVSAVIPSTSHRRLHSAASWSTKSREVEGSSGMLRHSRLARAALDGTRACLYPDYRPGDPGSSRTGGLAVGSWLSGCVEHRHHAGGVGREVVSQGDAPPVSTRSRSNRGDRLPGDSRGVPGCRRHPFPFPRYSFRFPGRDCSSSTRVAGYLRRVPP